MATEVYYRGLIEAVYPVQAQLNALFGVEGDTVAIKAYIVDVNVQCDKVLASIDAMSETTVDAILEAYDPEKKEDVERVETIPNELGLTDDQSLALASAVAVVSEADFT